MGFWDTASWASGLVGDRKNLDNVKMYGQGIANSFLPEFLDKDEVTWEDMSSGSQSAIQEFVNAQFKAKPWEGKRGFIYEDLNKHFKAKSIFEGGDAFSNVGALKTTLGQFTVEPTEDGGFNIIDTYDFNKNSKYGKPTMSNIGSYLNPWSDRDAPGTGLKAVAGRLYGAARLYGERQIPVGSPNAMKVNLRIPGRKTVSAPLAVNTGNDPANVNIPDKPIWQRVSDMLMPSAEAASRQEVTKQTADVFGDELQQQGWEGATVLEGQEEVAFREWFTKSPYALEYQQRNGRAPNMDDPDYDYRGLWKTYGPEKAFAKVEESDGQQYYHGYSRAPDGGKWLKNPSSNPTAWMEVAMSGLNPEFMAKNYGVQSEEQLHAAISKDNTPEGRAKWASIYQKSKDFDGHQAAKQQAAEQIAPTSPTGADTNLDKLSFGEAFKRALSDPATVAKGRFMWRGRPYAAKYEEK
tara:strand:- start:6312 stop:7706 length:1395 start_codon:yes stop_codon:yes gene_type:complete